MPFIVPVLLALLCASGVASAQSVSSTESLPHCDETCRESREAYLDWLDRQARGEKGDGRGGLTKPRFSGQYDPAKIFNREINTDFRKRNREIEGALR